MPSRGRAPAGAESYGLSPGRPDPLGATYDGYGVNFAVFSAEAEAMELCLFDRDGRREQARLPFTSRTGDIWHLHVADMRPGQLYGLRAHGPYRPEEGLRFKIGLVVESGQIASSHHIACALGFGAAAVYPLGVRLRAEELFGGETDACTAAFMKFRKAAEKALGVNPVDELARALSEEWGDPATRRLVTWPLTIRAGRID